MKIHVIFSGGLQAFMWETIEAKALTTGKVRKGSAEL